MYTLHNNNNDNNNDNNNNNNNTCIAPISILPFSSALKNKNISKRVKTIMCTLKLYEKSTFKSPLKPWTLFGLLNCCPPFHPQNLSSNSPCCLRYNFW